MQIIFKAGDITEAHIVSGLLNANNIETHVGGYYLQGGVGDLAAMDFVNVQVDDEDVVLAQPIIAEYESKQIEIGESTKVIAPDLFSRVFISIVAFLFIILIIFLISEFR